MENTLKIFYHSYHNLLTINQDFFMVDDELTYLEFLIIFHFIYTQKFRKVTRFFNLRVRLK